MLKKTFHAVLICSSITPFFASGVQLNGSAEEVFMEASMLLVDMGALPTFRDKELGVIKTDSLPMKLTATEANCGKMFGIPYIKDKRTKTAAIYQINIKKISETTSDITVKVSLDGYMDTNEGAPFFIGKTRDKSKVLSCKSTGILEANFIEKLSSE